MSSIEIDLDSWEQIGPADDPAARLLTELVINGTPHHLEAIAVQDYQAVTQQEAVDADNSDTLSALYQISGSDAGRFYTTEIDGREYVLWASPYQQ